MKSRVCLLVACTAFVCVDPSTAQNEEGGDGPQRIASSGTPTGRVNQPPDAQRLEQAAGDVLLVLVIGLAGFVVLILGKYLWYEPRFFQLPYRPTEIVKSFRAKALGKVSETCSNEAASSTEMVRGEVEVDLEQFYESLEDRSSD